LYLFDAKKVVGSRPGHDVPGSGGNPKDDSNEGLTSWNSKGIIAGEL